MRSALPQSLTYLLHDWTMQDLFNGVLIEIAQHVGITGTTGFYITSGIDVQAPPGSCTVKIVHALLIGVLAGEARFGKP